MNTTDRRHDIDWLRVIAIGLLLIYHVAICFQPWGLFIGFITNKEPWLELWTPMTLLNIWRIPLLFFVSGMGVYFATQSRTWQQLIKERAKRILLPFVFGVICIVPIQMGLLQYHYNWEISYTPNPAHLWFLGNIFIYVLLFTPLIIYLKSNAGGKITDFIKNGLSHPIGLLLVFALFGLEAIWVKPVPFELYAMTWHGFFLGLIAFIAGYCFVLSGSGFWTMIDKFRWLILALAISLYVYRFMQMPLSVSALQLAIESNLWILAIFAFGYRHLNKSSKTLSYLSQACYPVYIIHMVVLYLAGMLIFPLELAVELKFIATVVITSFGSLLIYELLIRRFKVTRLLFGLKMNS